MLKSLGIIRVIDKVGGVVIPSELRYSMKISDGDPLDFFVDDEKIILKKHFTGCVFCNNVEELKNINGRYICMSCLKELKELID